MIRRGKDAEKIKGVILKLINRETLEARHRDHALGRDYKGFRDCHVEPDWLLIYRFEGESIIFEITGTHADLFG
jgi:mRNA interferase YafQ